MDDQAFTVVDIGIEDPRMLQAEKRKKQYWESLFIWEGKRLLVKWLVVFEQSILFMFLYLGLEGSAPHGRNNWRQLTLKHGSLSAKDCSIIIMTWGWVG